MFGLITNYLNERRIKKRSDASIKNIRKSSIAPITSSELARAHGQSIALSPAAQDQMEEITRKPQEDSFVFVVPIFDSYSSGCDSSSFSSDSSSSSCDSSSSCGDSSCY